MRRCVRAVTHAARGIAQRAADVPRDLERVRMIAGLNRTSTGGGPVRRRRALAAGLGLALVLAAAAARAGEPSSLERCTREDAQTAEPVTALPGDNQPAASAIAAELAHPLPAMTPERSTLHGLPHASWSPLRFVDHLELGERIRSLRRVRLLRLWDDARLTVFFGLNRAGVAGLHFQQQDPGEPLLFERMAAPGQLPLLRAVPLDPR